MPQQSLTDLMQQAAAHHQAGRLAEAQQIYRQVLRDNPDHADALHGLGLLARQSNQPGIAAAYIGRAVQLNSFSGLFQYHYGDAFLALGDAPQAAACFRRATQLEASRPEPHAALGVALLTMQKLDEAIASFRKAIELGMDRPDIEQHLAEALGRAGQLDEAEAVARRIVQRNAGLPDVWHTLGDIMLKRNRPDEAIAAFRRAVELRPDSARSHHALGAALMLRGRLDEVIEALRTAVRLDDKLSLAWASLGSVLLQQQNLEEGIASLRRAVTLDPSLLDTHVELARGLELSGRNDEAAEVYREISRRWPGNPNVEFHVAALTGKNVPPAMPRSLVGALFDRHAGTFDEHLTRQLHYRAPQLLLDAVNAAGPGQNLSILDLGCGTGLCGALFRPMAANLIGVDLSPGMLAVARQRNLYDRLDESDIIVALRGAVASFDLVLAGDVLCYLGDLTEVFQAAFAALHPGGLFAFSLESQEGENWTLKPSRRYAHGESYVRDLATHEGFEMVTLQHAVLRTDQEKDVGGMIVVLRRPK